MSDDAPDSCRVLTQDLIEIWSVLEILTVSLDRIGTYWRIHGEQAGKDELIRFINPMLTSRIAHARHLAITALEAHNITIADQLENLTSVEDTFGYWDGPKQE